MARLGGITMLFLALAASGAQADAVDPIAKVLQMIGDLQGKIVSEGTDAQKVYDEFSEFCETRSRELGFEIKTGKGGVKSLSATIEDEAAKAEGLNAQIEELSGAIATDEADLKAATGIRAKENGAFVAEEKELVDVIGTLERAISILEKELAKGGASMMQLQSAKNVVQALSVMVDATSMSQADASKLTALLQNTQESEDESDSLGAPAAKVYEGKSGGIVDTMTDLHEKAEGQLEEARKAEAKSLAAFQMLAQSLKDEIKYANKDLDKAKKSLGASAEAKATAEGDLAVTTKDLDEDNKALATLHQDCMTGAEDFEAETKSRGEELHALATAKKVIVEATSGAVSQSYDFLQQSMSSSADLAKYEAVRFVRDLAHKQKSAALAQLASRMAVAIRSGSGSSDPFAKVKDLIKNMIEKLLKDGEADATEKAFCDKEMGETEAKKADKEAAVEKLSTSIDSMSAKSAQLKSEVATLQKELAAIASAQAEMDKLRAEEKAAYDKNSAEMEKGIKGVQLALKVLNDYYAKDSAHSSADGTGSGIIGLLEVCESDFTKGLAEMTATEETAVKEYDVTSKENDITKATKEQDAKYKTKEHKGLDKDATEATADRAGEQTELDATMEYYGGLKARCIAKPESYAERVERRTAEIAGLKEALSILDGQAVLLQRKTKHTLRGAKISHA
jgi:DNA repair exonuclease SbcCD ATPase subunit